jgi:syntaxin 5
MLTPPQIKQDLSALDRTIRDLQSVSQTQHPKTSPTDQEGEHTRNVIFLLRQSLGSITTQFKDTLELRTKTIQATRSRTENFISSVSAASNPSSLNPSRTDSPLYQTPAQQQQQQQQQQGGRRTPLYQNTSAATSDILSLDPAPASASSSALARSAPASSAQLLMMEEGQSNSYIQQRGEAIQTIETTISELSGIFTQCVFPVSASNLSFLMKC